jgi:DNA-binding FadR family transcriptional regulator
VISAPSSHLQLRPRTRAPKLADRLIADLSEQIRTGVLKPGNKLPTEYQIMREKAVSRAVVREAITRLQAAGLVQARQGIGTFVLETAQAGNFQFDPTTVLTMQDVFALLELRMGLESEAAALAAVRHTPVQLALIEDRMRPSAAGDSSDGETDKRDFEFHLAIAEASGNRYYVELLTQLNFVLRQRTQAEPTEREHREIVTAIAQRDAEAARVAMHAHLSQTRDQLLELQPS